MSAELRSEPADFATRNAVQQRIDAFPLMRYMGSKNRLLPWIYEILQEQEFHTVLDAFSGSGAVAYLCKAMGKRVLTNDFLHFSLILTKAIVENDTSRITPDHAALLLEPDPAAPDFIQKTFGGIFFFLPRICVFLTLFRTTSTKLATNTFGPLRWRR